MQHPVGCHSGGSGRKRDFIIGEYRVDATGERTTELPRAGPCGPGCRIRWHDTRERETGPGHPLLVVRCVVHGRSFTVYPPGFTPYGRQRLVPEQERWEATVFEAALDAAEGERWSDIGAKGGWWSTQWRHLVRLGVLLGLSVGEREGEQAGRALGVDLHVLVGGREGFRAGGYRRRGRAVLAVLEAVRGAGGDVLRRLLHAGRVTGLWGRGFFVDPRWGLRPAAAF